MTSIKAILFDKDGTLMNFHSVWVKAMHELLENMVGNNPDRTTILHQLADSIGLHGSQVAGDGILAGGTMEDVSEALFHILQRQSSMMETVEEFKANVSNKMVELTKKYVTDIHPTSDNLSFLLEQLKEKGITMGIATADDYETTHICLEYLQIKKYFEFVVTADRFPHKKPHPSVVHAFCEHYNLHPNEVAVIGDTVVDLSLAKNAGAGLAIGVLSGTSNRRQLEPLADYILPTVADLLTEQKEFIWNDTSKSLV
ncbi:HAD family hydrolase [Radiobacillus deserti]|uniref:HAD family hydrolase n=1 Tax=Radiobacillus deserti TaxID=2594883 RepID=A0A516KJ80_9BACI|nr:HAD family hydrolase [Radiobacillus deserti]QDP41436.1 HAD family hydrolase [Radiobacillus deserti]